MPSFQLEINANRIIQPFRFINQFKFGVSQLERFTSDRGSARGSGRRGRNRDGRLNEGRTFLARQRIGTVSDWAVRL